MRITLSRASLLAVLLSGAAACTQTPAVEDAPQGVKVIDEAISDAVVASSEANREVAEVEIATTGVAPPSNDVPPTVVLPPDAVQPVTVNWQGPVEPFLASMAARADYQFLVKGDAPANPIMLSITANEEPLFGVIRRAGNMASGSADIAFNPTSKIIEIRYGQ